MVGVIGFEPTTSASQTPRATNCATPRCFATVVAVYTINMYPSNSTSSAAAGSRLGVNLHVMVCRMYIHQDKLSLRTL